MKSSGIVLAVLTGACHASQVAAPTPAGGEAEVVALSRRIFERLRDKDQAGAAALFAPDFHYFSWRALPGHDRDKAQEVALNAGVSIESFDIHDVRTARIAPDDIELHYLIDLRVGMDGRLLCAHSGAVENWARRKDAWQLVARTEYLIGVLHPETCEEEAQHR